MLREGRLGVGFLGRRLHGSSPCQSHVLEVIAYLDPMSNGTGIPEVTSQASDEIGV